MKFDANQVMQRMMSHTFRPVDNIVWSMQSGNAAVIRSDKSIITFKDVGNEGQFALSEQLFDLFGMPIPAFAQQMALGQIKRGDIIVQNDGTNAWALGSEGNALRIVRVDGQVTSIVPTVLEGGFTDSSSTTFMVVRSLIDLIGGESKMGGFRDNLMPILMMSQMSGNKLDLKSIMPMMLMMGGSFGGNGGMGGIAQMMMMTQLMGGKSPF